VRNYDKAMVWLHIPKETHRKQDKIIPVSCNQDALLPDISPHPARVSYFGRVAREFGPQYPRGESICGLKA